MALNPRVPIPSVAISDRATGLINTDWYNYLASLGQATAQAGGGLSVRDFGAVGNGTADDTVAFQAAWDAATSSGGKVFIPAGIYSVGDLNCTNTDGIIVEGEGDASIIRCEATAHLFDLSGSSYIDFRDFKIISGTVIPVTLFCWASTASVGLVKHLHIDRVNVEAKSTAAHLFCFGGINGSFKDSTFIQTYDGLLQTDRAVNTCVVRLDALNYLGITSLYETLAGTIASDHVFENFDCIDYPGGSSNNSAMVLKQAGVLTYIGGSIQSVGFSALVGYTNIENLNFVGVRFQASDGSVACEHFAEFGPSFEPTTIGSVKFDSCLFSVAVGSVIGLGRPIGRLQIINPDVGGGTAPFVGAVAGSAFVDPWIYGSCLLQIQGLPLQAFGDITANVIIQEPGTIIMTSGVDNSWHV